MRTNLTLCLVLAVAAVGCVDHQPCGRLPGNQEARDRACSDNDSPHFHLAPSDCDPSYVTDTFKPAWCEVGCTPAPAETGPGCSNTFNPFFRGNVACEATHTANGEVGCCLAMASDDPVWGTKNPAVMFFACR
jgi:hypothetical protein